MYPRLLEIGSFVISSHDFFLGMGFFVGTLVFLREIKRDVENRAKLLDLAIYIIIFSLIGARLFHVVVSAPDYYFEKPLRILKIWHGGWTFYGGLLTGVAFGLFYAHRKKMNVWRCMDLFTPPLAIGLVFGRIACFMAGCCYGKICPTDFPLGIAFNIVDNVRPQASPLNTPLYPTQPAEGFLAASLFLFFIFYRPRKRFHGELAAIFLIVYSAWRFFIEYFRGDEIRGLWLDGLFSTSQLLSIPLFIVGVWILVSRRHVKNKP